VKASLLPRMFAAALTANPPAKGPLHASDQHTSPGHRGTGTPGIGYGLAAAAGAVIAKPEPGANVVTVGGIAFMVSIWAQAGHAW
jgi:hypothetical protein